MDPDRIPRFNLLGVQVHAVDYARATAEIMRAATGRRALAATALAVHGVMTGCIDDDQRARLDQLDLVMPDGQPVRWALNWLHGTRLTDRVYGPFLTLRLCAEAAATGLPVFLFGSTAEVLAKLSAGLLARTPGLRIAGMQPSRFRIATEREWAEDVRTIRASGARIVFCGLGCPRQEAWAHAMRKQLDLPIVAVGAAFPLWAGVQPMAPAWMQRRGLEWLFRLSREPRRLAHRYFTYNPRFALGVLRQRLKPDAYPVTDPAHEPAELRWS